MVSQETVWKNKLFRDDNNSKEPKKSLEEHPHVISIKQKIKNIKKRKQYSENFNRINPLSNVYEEPFSEVTKTESVTEGFDKQEDIDNALKESGGFQYDFYNFVFSIPNYIQISISNMCYSFAETFSEMDGRRPEQKDINDDSSTLQKIIYYSISYPITIFVAYNWFFLWAYIDKDSTKRPADDETRMKIPPDSLQLDGIGPIFNFFFDFILAPLYWFDFLFLGDKGIPAVFSLFKNVKIISRLLILAFSFFMVIVWNFFGSINDILFGTQFALVIICTVFIIIKYCMVLYNDVKVMTTKAPPPGVIPYILLFCYYLIRLVIAIVSIYISSIMIIIYFWVHSLFGMMIYGGVDVGIEMEKVDTYVNEDLKDFQNEGEDCIKISIIRKIINFVVNFLYKNIYLFGYFFILITYVQSFISNLHSTTLKQVVSSLYFVQIIIVCLYMWDNMSKKKRRENGGGARPADAPDPDDPAPDISTADASASTDDSDTDKATALLGSVKNVIHPSPAPDSADDSATD